MDKYDPVRQAPVEQTRQHTITVVLVAITLLRSRIGSMSEFYSRHKQGLHELKSEP